MEPIKEEDRRHSQSTTDVDSNPARSSVVDSVTSNHAKEKESPTSLSKKTLRFTRLRGSVDSSSSNDSDGNTNILARRPSSNPLIWRLGILEPTGTGEIPGSVRIFDAEIKTNTSTIISPPSVQSSRPSTLQAFARSEVGTVRSVLTSPWKRRTEDDRMLLEPQPDNTHGDPLHRTRWQKETAMVSLFLLTLIGSAMVAPLPSGLSSDDNIVQPSGVQSRLIDALLMVGLAVGHLILAPTAILFGKRLIYLLCGMLFLISCIWAAFVPSYAALIGARLLMGIAISPVEMLVPASIAELFYLHQRSVRLSIFVFFYLGGMAIMPAISGALVQQLQWRWLYIIWIILSFAAFVLLFLSVSESYYDRSLKPLHTMSCPKNRWKAGSIRSVRSLRSYFSHCTCPVFSPRSPHPGKPVTFERLSPGEIEQRVQAHRDRVLARIHAEKEQEQTRNPELVLSPPTESSVGSPPNMLSPKLSSIISPRKVGFVDEVIIDEAPKTPMRAMSGRRLHSDVQGSSDDAGAKELASSSLSPPTASPPRKSGRPRAASNSSSGSTTTITTAPRVAPPSRSHSMRSILRPISRSHSYKTETLQPPDLEQGLAAAAWTAHRPSLRLDLEDIMFDRASVGAFTQDTALSGYQNGLYYRSSQQPSSSGGASSAARHPRRHPNASYNAGVGAGAGFTYTERLRGLPAPLSWRQGLRLWHGRLVDDGWLVVACRPFVLLGAVARVQLLWAASVWALAVGWMGVLPRAVATVTASTASDATPGRQTGLLSLAVLVGVALATLLAGPLAERCVRAMARRNGGVLEPEFRLLPLVAPGMIFAIIGTIGFGCVVDNDDIGRTVTPWIVLGVFLVFIGFGCAATALAALNYIVDCLPGAVVEALVVLGLVKCLLPGLLLSLFLDQWIEARGVKEVFLVFGSVQLAVLLTTVPLFMFGKRIRSAGASKVVIFEVGNGNEAEHEKE